MKKFIIAIIALTMILLVACGGEKAPAEGPAPTENQTESEQKPAESNESKDTAEDFKAEEPVLLTSVGQSADVEMVKSILQKIEVNFTAKNLATSEDLEGFNTLLLAVGGSSKGLGAAGIDADAELARVTELIDAADSKDLKIIAVHIGGEARRGDLSDKFIVPSFEKADYAIVVKSGNTDDLMTNLASDSGFPLLQIDSITDTAGAFESIFK